MKLGAMVAPRGDDIEGFVRHVRRLEDAGVEYLWVGEAYSADAVTTMGFLAAITSRAKIGSAILPIYTRTPSNLAMTAVGLDRLSGGRAVLGLGASGPQVVEGFHGVPYDRPVGRTREIIEVCRAIWAREEPLRHDGRNYQMPLPDGEGTGLGKPLKLIGRPRRSDIPIFVASLGAGNVEMTAEVADGWLPLFYWPERADSVWGDALRAGRAKRGDYLGPLDVVAGGSLAIGADVEALRDRDRATAALYFGGMGARGRNFYNDLFRAYGYPEEADRIQDLYLSGRKAEAARRVPDELLAALNLIGDEGFVRDRVAAFADSGVTVLNVAPVGPSGLRDVETLAKWLA